MSTPLAHTREWVRAVVRSGLLESEELRLEVASVLASDHGLGAAEAGAWIAAETERWRADAAHWPETTDHDKLLLAFAALGQSGILVLQAVADHWVVKERLASSDARAAAWFTSADIWHAVDEPMFEVNLWHRSGANAAEGEDLVDIAIGCFTSAGLPAVFDEGRIEVRAHWQRRPR